MSDEYTPSAIAIREQRMPAVQQSGVAVYDSHTVRRQSLCDLLRILRIRWVSVLVVTLCVLGLGAAAYYLIYAFRGTTIMEINADNPANEGTSDALHTPTDDIQSEVQTDINILEEDDQLPLNVINRLSLMGREPFVRAIFPSESGKDLVDAPKTRDKAIAAFRKHLDISSPPDSRLIMIRYSNKDSQLAAAISNTLATVFIEDALARRRQSILTSSTWLQSELGDLKTQVEAAQRRLTDYEKETGLAGVALTNSAGANGSTTVGVSPQNTVTDRLFSLNQELTAAEANRISAETVYNLLRTRDPDAVLGLGPMATANGGAGAASSVYPESMAQLQLLRSQEADLERQLSAASVKYGENNPRRIEFQQQIHALHTQMDKEVGRLRSRASSDFAYAKRNEDAIREQFKKQESAAGAMADKTIKLQLLAQEALSTQNLYDDLFSKVQAAALALGARATHIDVVAEAIPEGFPSWPKLPVYVLAVVLLALTCGVSAAFIREVLDATVKSPRDSSDFQVATLAAYVPHLRLPRSKSAQGSNELVQRPTSPFSESFRAIRTALTHSLPQPGPRVVLVTSALGGAGKTTIVYNLGVAFAQLGNRVLLVDGDLRNGNLHRLFEAPNDTGVCEACSGAAANPEEYVLRHEQISTLYLLPSGKRPDLPTEILASRAFADLIQSASEEFDYVLIDSPPCLAVADAAIIAEHAVAMVGVLRSRVTTKLELSMLANTMASSKAPYVGFLFNDVRSPETNGLYTYSYSRRKGASYATLDRTAPN